MPEFQRRYLNARPSLNTSVQSQTVPSQSVPPHVMRSRRRIRPPDLLDAVRAIDTTVDSAGQQALINYLHQQYEAMQVGMLIGLFSHCYLGQPYVDHRVDLAGSILEHYTATDHLPPQFDSARPLARTNAYLYIEVYQDGHVIPVRHDGTTAN